MGIFFSHFVNRLFGPTPARICMLGLDAAGKTTVLYKLKLNEIVTTIPTIGFNVEEVQFQNLTMTIWDIGGQKTIRYIHCKQLNKSTDPYRYISQKSLEALPAKQRCPDLHR